MTAPAPILLGEVAAAAALGISARTLRTLRQRGDIGHVLIGHRLCLHARGRVGW